MDELVGQTLEEHLIEVMLNHQTTIGAKRSLTKITVSFTAHIKGILLGQIKCNGFHCLCIGQIMQLLQYQCPEHNVEIFNAQSLC